MPNIRPISDFRNKAKEISEICHSSGEPVFITKNGQEDLVVMSYALYEQQQARLELYQKLDEAEHSFLTGKRGITHKKMIDALKGRAKCLQNTR